MEPRCRHHADRSAVGACCYCERPLCGECLCANRQGRSYCRNEEDCLAYQEAQAPTENRIPPILRVLLDESALEDQVERLSECLEELEEMESVFEDSIVPNRTLQGGTPPHPRMSAEPTSGSLRSARLHSLAKHRACSTCSP